MLNLDQIKLLEDKVTKAVHLIRTLKEENDKLKLQLHDKQKRISDLENLVIAFRDDQSKIEDGIVNALNNLSAFEDSIYQNQQLANANVAQIPLTTNQRPPQQTQYIKNDDLADILGTDTPDPSEQMEIF